MPSQIKVDQIAGATGSTVTLPSGQTLDLSSGTVNLPSTSLSTLNATNLTTGTVPNARLSGITADKLDLISTASVPSVTAKGTPSVSDGYIQLNCEQNSHGIKIKSPPHSAAASYTMVMPNAIGTSNQVLRMNTGATALEFATPAVASSDFVLLATTDVTSSTASVSFDGYFSSTYKNYILYFTSLRPVTDDAKLYFRVRQSNADVTSSGYGFAQYGVYRQDGAGDGASTGGGNNTFATIDYNNGLSNDSNYGGQGTITIFNPLTTGNRLFQAHMTIFLPDETYARMTSNMIRWSGNTTALSGFTLFFSTGNIANGNFKLYGLK